MVSPLSLVPWLVEYSQLRSLGGKSRRYPFCKHVTDSRTAGASISTFQLAPLFWYSSTSSLTTLSQPSDTSPSSRRSHASTFQVLLSSFHVLFVCFLFSSGEAHSTPGPIGESSSSSSCLECSSWSSSAFNSGSKSLPPCRLESPKTEQSILGCSTAFASALLS